MRVGIGRYGWHGQTCLPVVAARVTSDTGKTLRSYPATPGRGLIYHRPDAPGGVARRMPPDYENHQLHHGELRGPGAELSGAGGLDAEPGCDDRVGFAGGIFGDGSGDRGGGD